MFIHSTMVYFILIVDYFVVSIKYFFHKVMRFGIVTAAGPKTELQPFCDACICI